jgi:acyl-coenzyme A synthetase/AMP-(fatty) acid ligase
MAYLDAQRQLPKGEKLFPRVRAFPGGASPKPPQLHYDVVAEMGGVGIVSGYGLTEFPIATMAHVTDSDEELANTEGSPGPGVTLKLVTLDGRVAGVDDEGEIRTKGRQMFRGYVDSSLDEAAFDEDGWFRTGDPRQGERARQRRDHRPPQGRDHPQGREHLGQGGGGPPLHAPEDRRRRGDRACRIRGWGSGVSR